MQRSCLQRLCFFLLSMCLLWIPVERVLAVIAKQAAVGQMVWVKGTVKAIAADKSTRALSRKSIIYEQDTIVTSHGSTGQIVFSDNTLLSLSEDTKIEIKQYKFTFGKKPAEDKYIVDVAKGGFRSISGAIAKSNRDNYLVNTPVATIGVRGTQYQLILDKTNKAYFQIEKGEIAIDSPSGSALLNEKNTEKFAEITKGGAPVLLREAPPIMNSTAAPPSITPATTTLEPSTASSTGAVPPASDDATVSPPGSNNSEKDGSTTDANEGSNNNDTSTTTTDDSTIVGGGDGDSAGGSDQSSEGASSSVGNSESNAISSGADSNVKSDGTVSSFCIQ